MKFTLVARQAAAVKAGLVGKVTVADLCFLDYLHGWFFCEGAETCFVEGKKFVWLHYGRAIEDLPMFFNPHAQIASRKNQLAALIQKLRKTELAETHTVGRRLFFRLTDLAVRVTKRSERLLPTGSKPPITVTSPHDDTVTPGQYRTVTSSRDEYLPAIIDETGIKESERRETPPISPCEGDADSIFSFWNTFPELQKVSALTPNRVRKIRKRLETLWWGEHWREGIQRLAKSDFAKGGGRNRWRATLDWFLRDDTLAKVIEGQYDNRPQTNPELTVSDIRAQIKAVEELIAGHPANDDNTAHDEDATSEQREDLKKLRRRRKELVRLLAGVPGTSRQPGDLNDWWTCPPDDLNGIIHGAKLSGDEKTAKRLSEIYEVRKNEPVRW